MKRLDSDFRVPNVKDLQTLLPIVVIKTSKRASAAIVILSVRGSVFPAQPYSGLIVCSQKRSDNLLELILVLPKKKGP